MQFPDLRLVVAGDGPARGDLEQLAAALGSAHAVDFIGWVSPQDFPRFLNRTTVVMVPSLCDEAFCLVALEAAQMGRPVVASEVGGLLEVVRHRQTGLTFPRGDAAALARSVRHS